MRSWLIGLGLVLVMTNLGNAQTLTTLASFNGTDGDVPLGDLTLVGSTLYGITPDGGTYGNGTIFSIPTSGGTPTDSSNQTTDYKYDGDNHLVKLTAVMPTGQPSQVTQYVYGVSPADGSTISSNDLLRKVEYPDPTTGLAGASAADQVSYTYDALGRTLTKTDQNGTVHTYTYDSAGRLALDSVTTLGAGVDGSVLAIGYAYDDVGRVSKVTSYNNAAGNPGTDNANVVNQVQTVYNGLGQIVTQYQADSGAVVVSSTPKVQYAYSGLAQGSRLTSMTYPSGGRVVTYHYGDEGAVTWLSAAQQSLDATVGRLSSISDNCGPSGASETLEGYDYLGDGTMVRCVQPQVGMELTYIKASGAPNGDGGDQYTGLDRFGRLIDQKWQTTGTTPTVLDEYTYTYDRDSNRLTETNFTADAANEHLDEAYTYDSLNRLTSATGGTADQSWSLDAVGNMASVTTGGTAVGRTSYADNEIASVGGQATVTYDGNGNMLTDGTYSYTYDAWNRQVAVNKISNGILVAEYQYDGRGYRTAAIVAQYGNPSTPTTATGFTRTDFYYDANWQVLEERTGVNTTFTQAANTVAATALYQYVWSHRYIDALVCRDQLSGANSGQRLYYTTDANFNVTALIDGTIGSSSLGQSLERESYAVYGQDTIYTADWSVVRSSSAYGNEVRYGGSMFELESSNDLNRNRVDDLRTDTWAQRDPDVYINGSNVYQSRMSNPPNGTDPRGLYFGLDDLLCTLGGAVVGVAGQFVGDLVTSAKAGSWKFSSGADYGAAAIGGAVAGEVSLYAGPVVGGLAGGAAGNFAKQKFRVSSGEQKSFDYGEFALNTALGGVGGKVKIPGITAGRGSYSQVYNQIVTKAENGTISGITGTTAAKMGVATAANGIGGAAQGAVVTSGLEGQEW